ncbi:putative protein N(5)-glutamine methyltransferase [Herbiconiux sp. A18JL235]|uniref:Methyltransferase domain-containing protein n=1 Tax=Herbiconiux sp. A18JL235 TaxID=3152363 RepID=A0AB39BHS6_9MICO
MKNEAALFVGAVEALRVAGCVFAEEEARLLIAAAGSERELDGLVARRAAGEPLEPLLGWVEFCGRRIAIDPGVFVPRRRTELLAERTVAEAERVRAERASRLRPGTDGRTTGAAGVVVLELCCGAGAVAAVVEAAGGFEVVAADVDPAAVANARTNLADAASVFEGDLYDALPERLRGRLDVIAANAPYVPTQAIATMPPEARDHEKRVALDGGTDGLDVQRRVIAEAPRWLTASGTLLIESSERQAPSTAALMTASGFDAEIVRDEERDATVVIGRIR